MVANDIVNRPSVLSISWGAAELQKSSSLLLWTRTGIATMHELFQAAAVRHNRVLAATGDRGSQGRITDLRAHVLYPHRFRRSLHAAAPRLAMLQTFPPTSKPGSDPAAAEARCSVCLCGNGRASPSSRSAPSTMERSCAACPTLPAMLRPAAS